MALASGNVGSAVNGSGGSSITITNLTVGSGEDRGVLVIAFSDHATVTMSTTSVVRKGTETFTEILDQDYGSGAYHFHVSMHYLVNPSSGSGDIVVTFGGSYTEVCAVAIEFSGIDQTTPFGTPVSNSLFDTAAETLTVSSVGSGDVVVDGVFCDNGSADEPTPGADQTLGVADNFGGTMYQLLSTQPGSAGGVMSWTLVNSSADWVAAAVAAKPVSGPAPRNPVAMDFYLE